MRSNNTVKLILLVITSYGLLCSALCHAQEDNSNPVSTLPFERVLTNDKGKKIKFIIKSYTEREVTVERNGKDIVILMSSLSKEDQEFFRAKLKAAAPELENTVKKTQVDNRKFFIGEWEYEHRGYKFRRILNPDGTAELWYNRRKYKIKGTDTWVGFTWKVNEKGNLSILDGRGIFHIEYAISNRPKYEITDLKGGNPLTKAIKLWKEPTTGPLVNEDGTLRRKPAGARYSRVVNVSSLRSDRLPQLVISSLNEGGKAYHAPDGTLLIKGTDRMHVRVVDAVDKNNKEVKGLEITDKDIKKVIDDEGKTIVQFIANSATWQVKMYDENAKLIKPILGEKLTHFFKLHLSDDRTVKIYGWIAHNFATPDGISVFKGGKYALISYEGKLLIPPLYEKPLKYIGNKKYQAEVNGETKTITIK